MLCPWLQIVRTVASSFLFPHRLSTRSHFFFFPRKTEFYVEDEDHSQQSDGGHSRKCGRHSEGPSYCEGTQKHPEEGLQSRQCRQLHFTGSPEQTTFNFQQIPGILIRATRSLKHPNSRQVSCFCTLLMFLSHLSGILYFVLWELAWVCVLLQVFSHHSHSCLYSQNILYIIIWLSSNITGFLACSTVISGQAATMFYLSWRQWHSQIPGPVGTQKSFVEKMKAAEVYLRGSFISLFASLLLPLWRHILPHPTSSFLCLHPSSSWLADDSYFQLPSGFVNTFTYVINYEPLESGKSVDHSKVLNPSVISRVHFTH